MYNFTWVNGTQSLTVELEFRIDPNMVNQIVHPRSVVDCFYSPHMIDKQVFAVFFPQLSCHAVLILFVHVGDFFWRFCTTLQYHLRK